MAETDAAAEVGRQDANEAVVTAAPAEEASTTAVEGTTADAPAEGPDSTQEGGEKTEAAELVAVSSEAAVAAEVAKEEDTGEGSTAKRPHEDDGEASGEQEAKRTNTGPAEEGQGHTGGEAQPQTDGMGEVSRVIQVPATLAGYIIGTRGETIRRLETNSGARIRLAQEGANRDVTITGTQQAVDSAVQLIEEVVRTERERSKARHPTEGDGTDIPDRIEFLCPRSRVGLIIGRGGEKIKALEERSGARIQVVQDRLPPYAEGKPVIVIGTRAAVEEARRQILGVIGDGFIMPSNYSLTVFNNPDGSVDMEVPAGVVGLVIGRQGDTIKSIQTETETTIEMERDNGEPMRKLKVMGSQEAVTKAFRKIMSIVEEARRRDEAAGRGFGANVPMVVETHAFPIASKVVGLVIGRGGETIHQIQDKTGSKVQQEPNPPPGALEKKFMITGTIDQIEAAKCMIWDRVGEGPMPMSYRTNGGLGYPPQGQPYDMYGGYPQQGYGAPVPQSGPYGQGGYGMPPPQGGQWGAQPYAQQWPQSGSQGQPPAEGEGQGGGQDYSQWAAAWQQYYNAQPGQQAPAPSQPGAQGPGAEYSQQWANWYQYYQQNPQAAAGAQSGGQAWTNDQWQQHYNSQGQQAPR